jgi:hypothetical protein
MTEEHPETAVINKQINRAIFIIVSPVWQPSQELMLRFSSTRLLRCAVVRRHLLRKSVTAYPLTTISAVHHLQVPQVVEIAFNDGFNGT